MRKFGMGKEYIPLFIIFILVNTICLIYTTALVQKGFDPLVIQGANLILFVLALIGAFMHNRAVKSNNPHAFVRSIMSAMVLKLFVIGASVFIYLYLAGAQRNVKGIVIGMVLYILYSILEVKGAYSLNKEKNGN
ncbi:MAG: hypothetical protein J0I41_11355 [Filimonas sp.]|nr:hypothetical protein [Filimonas sp.]